MTKKMLNYKTNQYFDNLPYHNVIKYDMGSEREVKQAYKDGYHECEKTLIEATEIIKELLDTQSCLDPYRDIYKDRIIKAEKFLQEMDK